LPREPGWDDTPSPRLEYRSVALLNCPVWRDNLDDWAATIRMTLWCRGAVMIAGFHDARKRLFGC
jgi:hypothetical protein